MFGLGAPELLVIVVVLVLLFGGTRIAKLGGGLGEAIANFKKGIAKPRDHYPPHPVPGRRGTRGSLRSEALD